MVQARKIAAALLLLAALPAPARTIDVKVVGSRTTSVELRRGLTAYDALDFEGALKAFEAAMGSEGLSPDEFAVAALYAGMIADSMGETARARTAFQRALAAVPEVELPEEAPPKTRKLFASVQAPQRTVVARPDPVATPIDPDATAGETPLYKKWWFWTVIGATVAAGATAAVLIAGSSEEDGGRSCSSPAGQGCIDVTVGVWGRR
jgi:hypothetical protein